MPPLTAQQAALAYDATVPLPVDPNADPNSLLPAGVALDALAPQESQSVGSAIENMSGQGKEQSNTVDHLGSKLLAGGRINITSQEQFNALSDAQKAVIRAAASTGNINSGVQIKSSDALRIYQDSVKQARQTQGQTISFQDGTKVNMVNGQVVAPTKPPDPVKMEIKQAEDGTYVMIDQHTGRSFPAWNESSGEPVRGQPKISEDNRVQFNQAHIELQRIQSELNQVNAIPTNKKVTQDDNGMWVPSDSFFGGENPEKVKARLLKAADYQSEKIRKIDPTNSVSAASASQSAPAATPSPTPSVTPAPTPRPNPMPTPSGNISKAQYDALAPGATFTWNGKTHTKK